MAKQLHPTDEPNEATDIPQASSKTNLSFQDLKNNDELSTTDLQKYIHLQSGLHTTRLHMADLHDRLSAIFPMSDNPSIHKLVNGLKDARIDVEMFERVITDRIADEIRKES